MTTTSNVIIRQGLCTCTNPPTHIGGLSEGYKAGAEYRFLLMSMNKHGKAYYRLFPSQEWPDFHEVCSVEDFDAHFSEIVPEVVG